MADWYETASADNGTATATRAAEANYQHTAVRVLAAFDASATADLTIDVGGTTQITYTIYDSDVIELDESVVTAKNEKLEAVLGASGAGGTVGNVTLIGNTRQVD